MTRLILPQRFECRDSTGACQFRTCAIELKAAGEEGQIEGYASVFGVEDSYGDVVAPGAFAASLAEHKAAGTMPALLWQHDELVGVWNTMSEDGRGLFGAGMLAVNIQRGKEARELMKLGVNMGLSIGFRARKWAYDKTNEIRTLTEIDLLEVSLVIFPANKQARVTGMKSAAVDEIEKPKDAERLLREAGLSKDEATAFVSKVMRMGEARREAPAPDAKAHAAADRLLAALKSTQEKPK